MMANCDTLMGHKSQKNIWMTSTMVRWETLNVNSWIYHLLARKFNLINTDNLWIDLKGSNVITLLDIDSNVFIALARLLKTTPMELDIFSKTKNLDDGRAILQVLLINPVPK